jgi:hypothetical protein
MQGAAAVEACGEVGGLIADLIAVACPHTGATHERSAVDQVRQARQSA